MRFQGAVVREQGVTFAVVVVKKHVLDNPTQREELRVGLASAFPGLPVTLMAQDYRGRPHYHGRKDVVRFLANVPFQAIPWRWYDLN